MRGRGCWRGGNGEGPGMGCARKVTEGMRSALSRALEGVLRVELGHARACVGLCMQIAVNPRKGGYFTAS